MSFDEARFKSIHQNLLSTNSEVSDNFQKAENILKLALLMDQSSLALNHSNETTCAIHYENLKNYRNFAAMNTEECLKVIPKETSLSDFQITLNADEFDPYLNIPCLDEFLDCKNEKVSKENIASLFHVTPQVPNIHGNKRIHENDALSDTTSKLTLLSPLETFLNSSKSSKSNRDDFGSSSANQIQNKTNSRDVETRFGMGDADEAKIQTNSDVANWTIPKTHVTDPQPPQKIAKNGPSSYQPPNQPLFSFDLTKKPETSSTPQRSNDFITAREELLRQKLQKDGYNSNQLSNESSARSSNQSTNQPLFSYGTSTKTLGISGSRRSVMSKFVPPISVEPNQPQATDKHDDKVQSDPDRLQHIEPKIIELIRSEIMVKSSPVDWNEIAGLEYAKATIQEAIIFPMLRPDIFTGLRRPPRGILLFGPPGTGKTLIGRCIAAKSQSTFFSISASSLTSKWIGESEKMVRALFAVASLHQPAVIFIDEIDSLLCSRSDTEHESSRRLKTEFLVQLDGARTSEDERVLIVGATNRPQELDDAARRRLTKRLYIPLPELDARIQILTLLLRKERNQISSEEIAEIGRLTDGFSGADMKTLCHEASMGPIRAIRFDEMESIHLNDVRLVNFTDFVCALKRVRASVSKDDLTQYEKWDSTYGLGASK